MCKLLAFDVTVGPYHQDILRRGLEQFATSRRRVLTPTLASSMLGGDGAVACLHLGGCALLAPSSPLSLSFFHPVVNPLARWRRVLPLILILLQLKRTNSRRCRPRRSSGTEA